MTNQQQADLMLREWQALRELPPEIRIEVLMRDFFAAPPPSDFLYEITLRDVAEQMAEA